ncbi:predicted protein [Sclerotinia sclerotiorum 1980 UF-70]|uniref:Uncharacterized protein n=1 Tax=Sclerotinia sclerotiorum (strain ATCC 18683 / 1980 / Ss-1) TaxID=665079 RepID=A7EPM8_SCLS1|nr:predicted protein [Sclerotinia sclerotiorum 1980 UF-70]EDO04794.1 predicted protein [Sclerotinia sclerotiorum 1980 UF-70]
MGAGTSGECALWALWCKVGDSQENQPGFKSSDNGGHASTTMRTVFTPQSV